MSAKVKQGHLRVAFLRLCSPESDQPPGVAEHMAARLNRMHSEQVRAKIQAAVLVQRLEGHAMGSVEMTNTQITAAIALLDRSVPKLQQIQHVGDGKDGEIAHSLKVEFVTNGGGAVS